MADQRNRPLSGPAPADHAVRLRPIAGVAPGTYLTLLYGVALVALLFLVAVYPGLRFNGSLLTFSSSPPGAAVYLDGRFAGTTPVTTRAAAGRRTVLLSKEHFQPREEQLEVGGRLLLSWPFPRRASHHLALRIEDPLPWREPRCLTWRRVRPSRASSPMPPPTSRVPACLRNWHSISCTTPCC